MDAGETREAFVIGMGEVGRRLAAALERSGWSVAAVSRHEGWSAAADPKVAAIRVVAVREENLAAVLERLPEDLDDARVLVQNGFLEPVHGDLRAATRGLVYFTSKGDFYRELCASPFYGPRAETLARALADGGIATEVAHAPSAGTRAMIVKGIWNAVVGLPLAAHGIDLATYLSERRAELDDLADESARAASAEYGVEVSATEAVAKILETSSDLGWVRGGRKALAWRNGALAWFGRRHGVPTPVNDRLLRSVGYDPEADPRDVAGA